MSFDYELLCKQITNQNTTLEENIINIKQKYSTDDQLFNYTGASWSFVTKLNGLLLIIYYILFAGVAIVLFISKKNTMGLYPKIGLIVVLGIFPFIFLWIELTIWEFIKYIWSFISGQIYYKGIEGRTNNIHY
jgi:hypothetical protein